MLLLTKAILVAICFWVLSLALLFIFPHVLPIISGFATLLSLPIAVCLLVLTVIALIKERRKRWAGVCAALILAISFFTFSKLTYWGARAHLYLNHKTYETTAARMLAAHDDAQRRTICGETCWLIASDPGPVVAFHYVDSFLNWDDIVYDPSGKVSAFKSWDERKRFNIYFISAEHLTGDWYLAHFGD
jgi:hypothetical protein